MVRDLISYTTSTCHKHIFDCIATIEKFVGGWPRCLISRL